MSCAMFLMLVGAKLVCGNDLESAGGSVESLEIDVLRLEKYLLDTDPVAAALE
eukprot:SAG31_NODE_29262_length_398_cov_0.795987_1_plen_52_part_01